MYLIHYNLKILIKHVGRLGIVKGYYNFYICTSIVISLSEPELEVGNICLSLIQVIIDSDILYLMQSPLKMYQVKL